MSKRYVAILAFLLSCLVFCHGCGGGSSGGGTDTTRGAVVFTIVWPSPGRVIPAASQSLRIRVLAGNQTVANQLIPRPPAGTNTTSVRFDSLAPGVVNVLVEAFPNVDGTGVVQAFGGITVAIIPGQTTQANIDPASTVVRLDLIPNPLRTLQKRSVAFTVSPRNGVGALVLVAPSSLTWTSNNTEVATVDGFGVVTGVSLGSTGVSVVDTESGQTAQSVVQVVPPIVIDPPSAIVTLGDSVQFSATVTLLSNPNVMWSVAEEGGGSITTSGHYSAPLFPGTFHIIATSVSDPTISASATVVVQSGSGTVIIQ